MTWTCARIFAKIWWSLVSLFVIDTVISIILAEAFSLWYRNSNVPWNPVVSFNRKLLPEVLIAIPLWLSFLALKLFRLRDYFGSRLVQQSQQHAELTGTAEKPAAPEPPDQQAAPRDRQHQPQPRRFRRILPPTKRSQASPTPQPLKAAPVHSQSSREKHPKNDYTLSQRLQQHLHDTVINDSPHWINKHNEESSDISAQDETLEEGNEEPRKVSPQDEAFAIAKADRKYAPSLDSTMSLNKSRGPVPLTDLSAINILGLSNETVPQDSFPTSKISLGSLLAAYIFDRPIDRDDEAGNSTSPYALLGNITDVPKSPVIVSSFSDQDDRTPPPADINTQCIIYDGGLRTATSTHTSVAKVTDLPEGSIAAPDSSDQNEEISPPVDSLSRHIDLDFTAENFASAHTPVVDTVNSPKDSIAVTTPPVRNAPKPGELAHVHHIASDNTGTSENYSDIGMAEDLAESQDPPTHIQEIENEPDFTAYRSNLLQEFSSITGAKVEKISSRAQFFAYHDSPTAEELLDAQREYERCCLARRASTDLSAKVFLVGIPVWRGHDRIKIYVKHDLHMWNRRPGWPEGYEPISEEKDLEAARRGEINAYDGIGSRWAHSESRATSQTG